MKKIWFVLLLSLFVLFGCSIKQVEDNGKIHVMTTVDPMYDMVKDIGGEYVDVSSVYPTNIDIHNYELTAQDMQAVVDSDLFFYVSYSADTFVKDLEASGSYHAKFINVSEHDAFKSQVEPDLYNEDGLIDPHVWVSPKKDMLMADVIKIELCTYDPDNCAYYTANYEKLIEELKVVDQLYVEFAEEQTTTIITSHEAFNYLVRDYGIDVKSVYGMSHDSEPTSKDIQGYIDYVNENNIEYIYVDSNDMQNKVMLQIQANTGCEILPIYNLEFVNDTYFIDSLKTNIESMAK